MTQSSGRRRDGVRVEIGLHRFGSEQTAPANLHECRKVGVPAVLERLDGDPEQRGKLLFGHEAEAVHQLAGGEFFARDHGSRGHGCG